MSETSDLEHLEAHLEKMRPEETLREEAAVVAALSHPESFIRSAAISALVRARQRTDEIRRRLSVESNDLVVSDICDALARLHDLESVPLIQFIARSNPSRLARASAIAAVVDLLHEGAASFLAERATDERDERVRLEIYRGLLVNGDDSAFDRMIEALGSADYQVRCASAALLSEYTPSSNRLRILEALHEALSRETTEAARSSIQLALDQVTS